jgi:hypothetical protein
MLSRAMNVFTLVVSAAAAARVIIDGQWSVWDWIYLALFTLLIVGCAYALITDRKKSA